MSLTVRLFEFNKRENSTLRPDETTHYTDLVGTLKESSPLLTPSIGFAISGSPANYNYAYIEEFSRYYFITNWTFYNRLWYAEMKVDVLASFKSEIGNSTQYILRSSSAFDGEIIDVLYPTKNTLVESVNLENQWNGFTYVVGIINGDGSSLGTVSYYGFTQAQFSALKTYLLTTDEWLNIDFTGIADMNTQLFKTTFNPFQYIVSCQIFPFEIAGEEKSSLEFGWWNLPISCSRLISLVSTHINIDIELPKHPQSESRGNYLNGTPFTTYLLNFAPWGTTLLDADVLRDATSVNLFSIIDLVTGIAYMEIRKNTNDSVLYRIETKVGIPIQLAQIGNDYISQASNIVNTASNITKSAFSLDVVGAIANTVSGIGNSIESSTPVMQTSGSNGCQSYRYTTPVLNAYFKIPVDDDNADRGRPLCGDRKISTLSGFIMVADADIEISGMADENRKIKDYMQGGFFYE